MKAKDLVEMIQKYGPEEEVLALIWFKDGFDFPDDDELQLTDDGWAKVVADMENGGFDADDQYISEKISDLCGEHSILVTREEE